MKNKLYRFLTILGLIALFTGCEKDGEKIVMLDDPIPPAILTMPNLTLDRANAGDSLEFIGTPVDPGFTASANYFLEACLAGTGFAEIAQVWTGVAVSSIKMTVGDINGILLKKFPADQASSLDFRLRSVLIVDAGSGALGTSTSPLEYISSTQNANVTIYGLPRLDLINSGKDQKVESALGNGIYSGIVKMDPASAFTLTNPDSGTNYGDATGALAVNGTAIIPPALGYHILNVDVPGLTYSFEEMQIGLVGSATPNQWDAPDQKMDYDQAAGTWSITLDLVDGDIKFRLNDGWAWNLGGTTDNLVHNGDNIAVLAGNYTITLTITDFAGELGTYTIVKN